MMFYLGPLPPAVLAAATLGPRWLRCGARGGQGLREPAGCGPGVTGAVVAAPAGASRLLRSAAAVRRARGRRAGGVGRGRCLFQRAGRLRRTTASWSSRSRGPAPEPWNSCRGPCLGESQFCISNSCVGCKWEAF